MKRLVLESIQGVEIYPIISLIIFMILFTAALIYTFQMKKDFIGQMAAMPLEEDHSNSKLTGHENE